MLMFVVVIHKPYLHRDGSAAESPHSRQSKSTDNTTTPQHGIHLLIRRSLSHTDHWLSNTDWYSRPERFIPSLFTPLQTPAVKMPVILQVGNLPSNRLALTNRVYISKTNFQALQAEARLHPEQNSSLILATVGPHVYAVEVNNEVPDTEVAMNGLQRRFGQFSLATRVEVKRFPIPPNFALASLELSVDTLAKKPASSSTSSSREPVRDIDTERLARDFLLNYEGQPFQVGLVVAMDFEGTKLELTVTSVGSLAILDEKANETMLEQGLKRNLGQLLEHTNLIFSKAKGCNSISLSGAHAASGSGGGHNIFLSDFDFQKLGIGGLDEEFNQIFRRAFASRIFPPHIVKQLGILHVRGMLLYGPPGCGKTLIARQIGKALNAREPKIVNGPEILNKYVGGSEEKIRELFAEAEKEQKEAGDASMLHIIILDELDAICKTRGTVRDGTGVSDSIVNQLLSKIDGVDSLNNILLIGMTNRKDMIDEALLRPGRMEVHVEIGLPDVKGRIQILNIHTKNMKASNRITTEVLDKLPEVAERTKNFSGAELEGLVKAASSYALTRCVDLNNLSKAPDASKLVVNFDDFERALNDVQPSFGVKSQELKAMFRNGFIPYGETFDNLITTMDRLIEQVRSSDRTPLMTVLLRGPPGCGKTAIAAKVAVDSGYPFVRMISADEMIGHSETSKCQMIHKVFLDSYKSPLSLVFIDDIERIIEYVPIGPRFSNLVLQTLLVLLKKTPPDIGRKLVVLGTTSVPNFLEDLGLTQAFSVSQIVNLLQEPTEVSEVLRVVGHVSDQDASKMASLITKPIGIKQLLMVIEMARQASTNGIIGVNEFFECLQSIGY